MDEQQPTRQQRDIIDNLNQTLGSFTQAQTPYTDGQAPTPPAGRRKNPRALIIAASRIRIDPDQVRRRDRDPTRPASRSWPARSRKSASSTRSASARPTTASTTSSTAKAASSRITQVLGRDRGRSHARRCQGRGHRLASAAREHPPHQPRPAGLEHSDSPSPRQGLQAWPRSPSAWPRAKPGSRRR